jgi:histone-lysine N-methyltransferase SUV420H
MTPDINIRPRVIKRTPRSFSRFQSQNSPLGKSPSPEPSASPLKRKRDDELSPSPASKKVWRMPLVKSEPSNLSFSEVVVNAQSPPASASESRLPSFSPSGTDGQNTTDATSVDEDTIIVEQPKITSPVLSRLRKARSSKSLSSEHIKSEGPIAVGETTNAKHPIIQDDEDSVLSDLNSGMFSDVEATMSVGLAPAGESLNTPKQKRRGKVARPKTDLDYAPSIRKPGDYVLTLSLLSEPQMAWITCKICEESFVQKDAYFTRSSCPRCERHSKLYGYRWPKTDKEGEDDEEERVLDHRTVHRFIAPCEERLIRKRNHSMTESRATTRELSEIALAEEGDIGIDEPKPRRKYKRRSRLTM